MALARMRQNNNRRMGANDERDRIDSWGRIKVLTAFLATVLVPLAVAFFGWVYSTAVKDADTQVRYVELATGVLSARPSTDSQSLRVWAIDVVNEFSPVKLSPEAKASLLTRPLVTEYQSRVESFIQEEWTPAFVANYVERAAPHIRIAVAGGDSTALVTELTEMMLAGIEGIETQRQELLGQIAKVLSLDEEAAAELLRVLDKSGTSSRAQIDMKELIDAVENAKSDDNKAIEH